MSSLPMCRPRAGIARVLGVGGSAVAATSRAAAESDRRLQPSIVEQVTRIPASLNKEAGGCSVRSPAGRKEGGLVC